MATTEPMLLAARNAFIVLILVLFGLSVYQFITQDGFLAGALWTLGVAIFYGSKYYYKRQSGPKNDDNTERTPS